MNQRLHELDALRGIAAMMVVLFHYTTRYNDLYYHLYLFPFEIFRYGFFGVQLFFIISGFVIFMTLARTKLPMDFVVSRFSRLYPAYWAAIALTFTVVSVFSLPGREKDISTALINLTMLQKWMGVEDVDPVYWTLALELSFYAIMFVLHITRLIKKIDLICFAWLALIAVAHTLEQQLEMGIPAVIKISLLLSHGHFFIAGIFFYKLKSSKENKYLFYLIPCLAVEYYTSGSLVFLLAGYFLVFWAFAKDKLSILAAKPLVFLGTISYSLYLIHQNLGYVVIRWLYSLGVTSPFILIPVPIIVALCVASLMQRYVEQPSLNYIRDNWKAYKHKRYARVQLAK